MFVVAERPAWMADAACSGLDVNVFFPGKGDLVGFRRARAVCAACPVRVDCLDHALEHEPGERHGILGGLLPRERRRLALDRPPTRGERGVSNSPPFPAEVEPVVVRMRSVYASAL